MKTTQAERDASARWRARNPGRAAEIVRARRKLDPDGVRRNRLDSRYGSGAADEYARLFELQGGKCAICRRARTEDGRALHLDHCHSYGDFRGLLCHRCNIGIGLFDDDIELLQAAVRYLSEGIGMAKRKAFGGKKAAPFTKTGRKKASKRTARGTKRKA